MKTRLAALVLSAFMVLPYAVVAENDQEVQGVATKSSADVNSGKEERKTVGTIIAIQGRAIASAEGRTSRELQLKSPVFVDDKIVTEKGAKLQIMFNDDSVVSQGEQSEITINAYVYTPGDKENVNCSLDIVKGIFRVVTGKITDLNPKRFKVRTRMATIGIRGCELGFRVTEKSENVYIIELHGQETVMVYAKPNVGGGEWNGLIDEQWDDPDVAKQHLKNVTRDNRVITIVQGVGVSEREIRAEELAALIEAVTPTGLSSGSDESSGEETSSGEEQDDETTEEDQSSGGTGESTEGEDQSSGGTGESTEGEDQSSGGTGESTEDGGDQSAGGTGELTDQSAGEGGAEPVAGDSSGDGAAVVEPGSALPGDPQSGPSGGGSVFDGGLTGDGLGGDTFSGNNMTPNETFGNIVDNTLQSGSELLPEETTADTTGETPAGDVPAGDVPEDTPVTPTGPALVGSDAGTGWDWGLWNDGTVQYSGDFLSASEFQGIADGTTLHTLTGSGASSAVIRHTNTKLVTGTCELNVMAGQKIAPYWDGTFRMKNGDGDYLDFDAAGNIQSEGVMTGNQMWYNMKVNNVDFKRSSVTGESIGGRLVGPGSGAKPITGAAGKYHFEHGGAATVDGGFGANLN